VEIFLTSSRLDKKELRKHVFLSWGIFLHEAEMKAALLTDTGFAKILVLFLCVPQSWSFGGYIWLLLTPFIWDLIEEEKMSSCFVQDTGTALH
jgi:hypothetical protein